MPKEFLLLLAAAACLQGDYVGFNNGNGEKLSHSQVEPGRPAAWL